MKAFSTSKLFIQLGEPVGKSDGYFISRKLFSYYEILQQGMVKNE